MLTGTAREQLKNILEFSTLKDLKIIELKMVPDLPTSNTNDEIIDAILASASQPSQILRQQRLRKFILRDYLWQIGIPVSQEQKKSDYIRILLELWQVKDDDYLWKFRTDAEIADELDRFGTNMMGSIQELKLRIRETRPSEKELRAMKRSMDAFLKTFDSVGRTGTLSSTSNDVPRFLNLAFSDNDDDDDDDDSSSASSVEIIDDSPNAEFALSQVKKELLPPNSDSKCKTPVKKEPTSQCEETVENNFRRSSLELPSPMDTSEPGPSGRLTSHNTPNSTPLKSSALKTSRSAESSPSKNSTLGKKEKIFLKVSHDEAKEIIETLFKKYAGKD